MPPKPATPKPRTFAPRLAKPVGEYCDGCALETRGPGYVPASGNERAPIVLVGEGPWFDEVAQGEPFVGAAGSMLQRVLRLIGRQRESYRLDNVIRCACPSGSLEKWSQPEAIIAQCRYLDRTLQSEHTKVVVPLGGIALRRVLGLRPEGVRVQDFHGTVQRDPTDRFWVVPSYHPSHLQRGATNLMGVAAFDLQRAQEVAEGRWQPDVERLILDPPVEWFAAWADQYIAAATQDPYAYPLSTDVETPEGTATKGETLTAAQDDSYTILRINFSCDPEEGITVPFEGAYLPIIARVLAAGGIKYFWFKGYDEPRLIHAQVLSAVRTDRLLNLDLMWAWKALQAALPMGLGHAAPFYCRNGAWKHFAKQGRGVEYAALDGCRTRRTGDGILSDLQAQGRANVFWRHQQRFHTLILQPATDIGLAIDRPRLAEFKTKLDTKAADLLQTMQQHVPEEVRPLTPTAGLTREPPPGLVHTKARMTTKDGRMKADPPDPLKAEVYKLAVVVKKLVLREITVCKTCGKQEVAKTHRCQPALPGVAEIRPVCDVCAGKGAGNFATGETVECPFCAGTGIEPAVPQLVREVASVTRWFWQEPFNPDSPAQWLALGKALKLKPGQDKHSGNDSADRETLQRWAKEAKEPAAAAIRAGIAYKAIAKVRGTYVLGTERRLDAEDRVHGEFTFKPETMRLSAVSPNLQNVVADKGGAETLAAGFRYCVVARGREVEEGSEYADV